MKLKRCIAFILCTIFIVTGIPTDTNVHAAEATDNHVNGIVPLKAGETYFYDLNADGVKERIMYKTTNIENEELYRSTFELYINDKLCLSKEHEGGIYEMQICDLDTSDNYLDLYLSLRVESDCIDYTSFIRFNGEKLTEITGLDKIKRKQFGYSRFSLNKINGDGTFTIYADTPYYSYAVGCYYCEIPYQLKEGKISTIPTQSYPFNKYSKSIKYKAKKNFSVYQKAGSKKVAFQVKKGTIVTFDELYMTYSGKVYFRLKNNKGKTGYISGLQKDLFKEVPGWG